MEISNSIKEVSLLPVSQQQWVNLRVGHQKAKSLSEIELKTHCAKIIKRAFDYSTPNSVTDVQILTAQTLELFTILKGKFGELTIPEVKIAFKNGLDGVYCPYFGLCGKTYNQFLKGFYEDINRGKAWLAYLDEVEKQSKPMELTKEQKMEIGKQGAIKRFEDYKKTGELGFIPSATYNILNELIGIEYVHPVKGLIKTLITDKDVRINIFMECKEVYLNELNTHKKRATFRKDKDMVMDLDYMIANFAGQNTFENMVKDSMLKWYFDNLIRMNKNLEI